MQVNLVHNPTSGVKPTRPETLRQLLQTAGHSCAYWSTKEDWKQALQQKCDLIVAAGGDGTVKKLACCLAGKNGPPIAILPTGTSNNVACSLKAFGERGNRRRLERLIDDWRGWQPQPFDMGLAKGPWGEQPFIEAAGVGLLPRWMRLAETLPPAPLPPCRTKAVRYGRRLFAALAESVVPESCEARADGEHFACTALFVEVMNITSLGPRVGLAPAADPADGELDLVVAEPSDRDTLAEALWKLAEDKPEALLQFQCRTRRAKRLTITGEGLIGHIDDKPHLLTPQQGRETVTLEFEVLPAAVEILRPMVSK